MFQPLIDLFVDIWNNVSKFFEFTWDLITWFYYWFNTLISTLRSNFQWVLGINFFGDNTANITYLAWFLGVSVASLFMWLLLCAMFYVVFRFIVKLIPFFK